MMEESIKELDDGTVTIPIEVVPHSKTFSISWDPWRERIKLKVTSKAQKGKANEEIISFFKEIGEVNIAMGSLGREKVIRIKAERQIVLDHIKRYLVE